MDTRMQSAGLWNCVHISFARSKIKMRTTPLTHQKEGHPNGCPFLYPDLLLCIEKCLPALFDNFHGFFLAVLFAHFHLDVLQNLVIGEEIGDFLQDEGGQVGQFLFVIVPGIAVHHADQLIVHGAIIHHA